MMSGVYDKKCKTRPKQDFKFECKLQSCFFIFLYIKECPCFSFFADDVELLMNRTTALAAQSCDGLFNNGFRTDGVYDMIIGGRFLPMFCEFGRGSYNWLVSNQNILLYKTSVALLPRCVSNLAVLFVSGRIV